MFQVLVLFRSIVVVKISVPGYFFFHVILDVKRI